MALNPGIILAGETPNFLQTIAQADTAAARQNEFQRTNALAGFMQENGAGVMAGDHNALAGYARFDPQAALGIQSTRQDMQAQQQRMDILSAQERRQAEEYARGLSAQQAQAEAAQIEDAVKMGLAIQDEATWDQTMARMRPELVGQFGNRRALANRYMSVAEIMKGQQGATFRPASQQEAAQYGAAGGQIGPDGRFYPINPPSGMSVEAGPDGQLRIVQGPGAGQGPAKPFTEAQSKDNVYATRAEGALKVLEPVAGSLTSRSDLVADMVPLGLARGTQSDQFQVARNAGNEFLQAILRKDTGAAITAQEQELYGKTYLPQPGDGGAVLEAKKAARARALAALRSGMSADQGAAVDRALVDAARRTEQGGALIPPSQPEVPTISDDASYDALPSGTEFVGPDGTRRRKP